MAPDSSSEGGYAPLTLRLVERRGLRPPRTPPALRSERPGTAVALLYRRRFLTHELLLNPLSVEQLTELATTQRLDLQLGGVLRHRTARRVIEGRRRGRRRRSEPDVLLAEAHLCLGLRDTGLRRLSHVRRGTAREQPGYERPHGERSTRVHGAGRAAAGVSAAVRGDGAPTWM